MIGYPALSVCRGKQVFYGGCKVVLGQGDWVFGLGGRGKGIWDAVMRAVLWVLICTVHLAVCFCRVGCAFLHAVWLPGCLGVPCSNRAQGLGFGPSLAGGGGFLGCVQSQELGTHASRFIMLVSFSDILIVVLILETVCECHMRPLLQSWKVKWLQLPWISRLWVRVQLQSL